MSLSVSHVDLAGEAGAVLAVWVAAAAAAQGVAWYVKHRAAAAKRPQAGKPRVNKQQLLQVLTSTKANVESASVSDVIVCGPAVIQTMCGGALRQ
jgi:hypothetical protein